MDHANPGKVCVVCFSSISPRNNTKESEKVFNIFSTYMEDLLNNLIVLQCSFGNGSPQQSFCKQCFDAGIELSHMLTDPLKLQKEVWEFTKTLSQSIHNRRTQNINRNTISTSSPTLQLRHGMGIQWGQAPLKFVLASNDIIIGNSPEETNGLNNDEEDLDSCVKEYPDVTLEEIESENLQLDELPSCLLETYFDDVINCELGDDDSISIFAEDFPTPSADSLQIASKACGESLLENGTTITEIGNKVVLHEKSGLPKGFPNRCSKHIDPKLLAKVRVKLDVNAVSNYRRRVRFGCHKCNFVGFDRRDFNHHIRRHGGKL